MLSQAVFNTSEICHSFGVKHAVFSPGSRNAPLIVSFSRNEKIQKHIIPDERSAGFIALGIAQKLGEPVVLCCTSGTALLNYYPAIAEAFYREIPLIVLSADRPPELIDQRDGQTIRQFEALKNHIKASIQLPVVESEADGRDYEERLENAFADISSLPKGPIHINVPFREPFYPTEDQEFSFTYVPQKRNVNAIVSKDYQAPKLAGKKVLVLVGQQNEDQELSKYLNEVADYVPVIQSPLNNLQVEGIEHIDLFLDSQEELRPDVLITSGLSVLSKKLKNYLKAHTPREHFHLDPAGVEVDTYRSNPILIQSDLLSFLQECDFEAVDKSYVEAWRIRSKQTKQAIPSAISQIQFSECKAFSQASTSLPKNIDLHLSNSMPVRFADMLGVQGIRSWCNRGTSGIDGSNSTAVGTSLVSEELSVLLTGDVSFFYDRNAFFHNYSLPNLRIVVFNNQGGGIFRLIDGPKRLPELNDYFETRHNRTAKYICEENGFEYLTASNEDEVNEALKSFYKSSDKTKLLEIFTVPEINEQAFKEFKQHINEQLNF